MNITSVQLEKISSSQDFYKDQKKVKKIVKEKKFYEEIISSQKSSSQEIDNIIELYQLGNEENDQEVIDDCEKKNRKNNTCN